MGQPGSTHLICFLKPSRTTTSDYFESWLLGQVGSLPRRANLFAHAHSGAQARSVRTGSGGKTAGPAPFRRPARPCPRAPVPAGGLLRPCEGRPRFPAPARAAASGPWPSSDFSPVARPEGPADPSAAMGPRAAGPPCARDPATRDAPHPRPHLLRHRADGLVGGSEDGARPRSLTAQASSSL